MGQVLIYVILIQAESEFIEDAKHGRVGTESNKLAMDHAETLPIRLPT